MNIMPLNGRVLVRKLDVKNVGGIFVTHQGSAQNETIHAEVINVGKFEKDKVFDINKGDIVVFSPLRGNIVSYLGEKKEYMIIKAEDILGVEMHEEKGE